MTKGTATAIQRHLHKLVRRHNDTLATDRELLRRFAAEQDEAAFEILFRRHGAMVLAAGKRVLANAHDAEDVRQAAFLLLAKKASSQRWQSSVANWLYQTAHQLALKTRTAATRRARRARAIAPRSPSNPLAEITGQELLTALDEQLLALPEQLRAPLVLCYLEGMTRDEAAQRLDCPLATLKHRLQRGRHRLHAALLRRGLSLSAGLFGTLASAQPADAAATIALARSTARAALALAAGKALDGVVSSRVSQMVQGSLPPICGSTCKAGLALLLGGLLAIGATIALSADKLADPPPQQAPALPDNQAARPVATPAQAQGTILRYQFKEGDQFRYVVEQKTETTTTGGPDERFGSTTRTYDVTWRVRSVDADGNAQVRLTIDRVRYVDDSGTPGKLTFKVTFDSQKNQQPEGPPTMVRVLSPILKALVRAEFTCTVSPRGELREFKVPKKVADIVKKTPGLRAVYSAESFQQQLAGLGGVVLPKESVSQGTGWNEKADVVIVGGHAKMAVDTKATYRGPADRGEKKVDEVALTPKVTAVNQAPTSGLDPLTLKSYDGKGSMLVDNSMGRLIAAELTQDLNLESGPSGQSAKLVWKLKYSISTKLLPAK